MARRISILVLLLVAVAILGRSLANPASAAQTRTGDTVIAGSVVNPSLQPLANADVTIAQGRQVIAHQRTGADGTFRFDRLAPGTYRISASLTGFEPTTKDVTVRVAEMVQAPMLLVPPGFAETEAAGGDQSKVFSAIGSTVAGAAPPPLVTPAARSVEQLHLAGRGGSAAVANEFYLIDDWRAPRPRPSGETYSQFESNRFQRTLDAPLSTFSADVDTASYSNVRRFLQSGQLPPTDAVRVEELINYFRMSYGAASSSGPIAVTTEVGDAPWAPGHKLVLVGVEGRANGAREVEGRNIVLLVDVSGSMAPANRLPLIKTALAMFVDTLRPDDRLAIVTYAGQSGVALPSTPARERDRILTAIRNLGAGGSTNGAQGLVTAYRIARQSYIPGGVNRVILVTDGDFNVGVVGERSLQGLIEQERRSGVFLSVLGVGEGNLKDRTMEMLADHGNGHYAYIDTLAEARRVLVKEGDATLETVAKDVKFQVEFNPAAVAAWKLIGYENRALRAEEFNDDRKDAGDIGAGHSVTVLYEVIPAGALVGDDDGNPRPAVDPLKYQATPRLESRPVVTGPAGELATVKIRYKRPESDDSRLTEHVVRGGGRSTNLAFAASVAQYGMLLRSERSSAADWDALIARLRTISPPAGAAEDFAGFKELVELARGMVKARFGSLDISEHTNQHESYAHHAGPAGGSR